MGGNKQKKSSFFSFFKTKKCHKYEDHSYEDVCSTKKVHPIDYDKTLKVVVKPSIDKEASAFIANFHASRVSEANFHATRVSEAIHHTRQAENELMSTHFSSTSL